MSAIVNPAVVLHRSDMQKLLEEIDRYLAAVDLFRAENCEPIWRPEPLSEARSTGAAVSRRVPSELRLG